MPESPPSNDRSRPSAPNDDSTDERARRRETFEADEGRADDLVVMLRKFGRRALAYQAHVYNVFSSLRSDMERRALMRALDYDEERYDFVTRRASEVKTQAREHLMKAVALNLDMLSTRLEVFRGNLDYYFERIRRGWENEAKLTTIVDKLLNLKPEDVQLSIVRSLVMKEMVRDLIRGDDDKFPRLTDAEERDLIAWVTGASPEPPDIVKRLLRARHGTRPAAHEHGDQPEGNEEGMRQVRLDVVPMIVRPPVLAKDQSIEASIELENRTSDDLDLSISVSPCVSLAPPGWDKDMPVPWMDSRFQLPVEIALNSNDWVLHPDDEPAADVTRKLAQFGKVTIRAAIRWHSWFNEHHQQMDRFERDLESELQKHQPEPIRDERPSEDVEKAVEETQRNIDSAKQQLATLEKVERDLDSELQKDQPERIRDERPREDIEKDLEERKRKIDSAKQQLARDVEKALEETKRKIDSAKQQLATQEKVVASIEKGPREIVELRSRLGDSPESDITDLVESETRLGGERDQARAALPTLRGRLAGLNAAFQLLAREQALLQLKRQKEIIETSRKEGRRYRIYLYVPKLAKKLTIEFNGESSYSAPASSTASGQQTS
jgi:hypothetical protein